MIFGEGKDERDFIGIILRPKALEVISRNLGVVMTLESFQIDTGRQSLIARFLEIVTA